MSADEQLTLGIGDVGPQDPLSYGEMTFEQGLEALGALAHHFVPANRNEATTRRQLIDKLLFGCLGWHENDAVFEDRVASAGTYTDYTFALPRPIFILEAKRESSTFEVPVGSQRRVPLRTLCRQNTALMEAVDQVRQYCLHKGVQYAAVANGPQLVIFAAIRTDGTDPMDGSAYVFTSFEDMAAGFLALWNLISRAAMLENRLRQELIGGTPAQIPPKLASQISSFPGTKNRNPFQAQLRSVTELVLEDITTSREVEPRFLRECYCENGALEQHSLETRTILRARYAQLFDEANPGPAPTALDTKAFAPEVLGGLVSNRPVLLIGDVGVGKTTFVKHLLVSEDQDIVDNAIILYVDLGSSQAITTDFNASILEALQEQLLVEYQINIEDNDFVRRVYKGDLERRRHGVQKQVRAIDHDAYVLGEVKYLEERLARPDRHMKLALDQIAGSWHRQVIIILDNCDQRSADIQERAFVIGQEMATNWPALVFLSLRPETFHASRRRGALTGYHPRAFTISPPRVDDVIEKRLQFALKIARGEVPLGTAYGSFLGRFGKLEQLIRIFLRSLRSNVQLKECIENISGGNVRLALNLIREFFGSGHANTEKMVRLFEEQGDYRIPVHEFLRAVIYGDRVYYDPSESPAVNLFDVGSADQREHFLLPAVLAGLSTLMDPKVEKGFVLSAHVYDGMQGAGFLPEQIDNAISRAVKGKLVETVARRLPEPGSAASPSLRIMSVGLYHLIRLARQFAYCDAVVVDTPIFDMPLRSHIQDVSDIESRLKRAELFVQYLDGVWRSSTMPIPWFDWEPTHRDLSFSIRQVRQRALPVSPSARGARP